MSRVGWTSLTFALPLPCFGGKWSNACRTNDQGPAAAVQCTPDIPLKKYMAMFHLLQVRIGVEECTGTYCCHCVPFGKNAS